MEVPILTLQNHRLAYPEAAWISYCGKYFPSRTQWVYKPLLGVDTVPKLDLPSGVDNTSTSTLVYGTKAVVGSGSTLSGEKIQEKVSLDWVKWAISRKVWNLLYTKDKVDTTEAGKELILNEVRDVLKVAVDEGIFVSYRITEVVIDGVNNNLAIKFTATLEHTILAVDINGSLYY